MFCNCVKEKAMKTLKQFLKKCCVVLIILQLYGFEKNIAQPRTGDWTVPTGFGQFVITVACGGMCISDIIYTWSNFHCDGVTYVSGSIHSMRTGGWAITDRIFSIVTSLGTSQTMTIIGTFNQSGNEVSGTYSANMYGTICSGVWGPIMSSIDNKENEIPTNYFLFQNYPNPFNPSTVIQFSIPEEVFVSLHVYNTVGEKIAELVNKQLSASTYSVNFDTSDLPNGVYFYKIQAGDFTQTKKMILLK